MNTHTTLSALLLLVCSLYSGANWARGHFGFYFGAGPGGLADIIDSAP